MNLAESVQRSVIAGVAANPVTATYGTIAVPGLLSPRDFTSPNEVGGLAGLYAWAFVVPSKKLVSNVITPFFTTRPTVGGTFTISHNGANVIAKIERVTDDSAGLDSTITFELATPHLE